VTAVALLPISDERAARLMAQLQAHADDAGGACRSCRRHRCIYWQDAFAELAAGGRIDVGPIKAWGQADLQPPQASGGA